MSVAIAALIPAWWFVLQAMDASQSFSPVLVLSLAMTGFAWALALRPKQAAATYGRLIVPLWIPGTVALSAWGIYLALK